MPSSEQLVQAFIVVVVVNIAILELAVFLLWRRRSVGTTSPASPGDHGLAASMSSMTAGGSMRGNGMSTSATEPEVDESSSGQAAGEVAGDDAVGTETGPLVDPMTGLEAPVVWFDAVRHEDARRARYGHGATVVVLDLVGFDQLAERLGRDVADRLIVPVAATLVRNSRSSDRVARVGHTRFHVLMPETDEVSAINYVDRVREATDMWLEAGAVAVRVAIGWASPASGESLADALRTAEERMAADRHARPARRSPSRARPSMGSPAA